MKITNVEVIPITIPLARRYHNEPGRLRMYDIDQHQAVRVTTDSGIVGYGSQEEGRPLLDDAQKSIGGSGGFSQITGFEEGDLRSVRFEAWTDDGSQDYATAKARLESEG